MRGSLHLLLLLVLPVLMSTCGAPRTPSPEERSSHLRDDLARANELAANRSELQIQSYIRRARLDSLQDNGQGLHYRIRGEALGPIPHEGIRVAVALTTELLDGSQVQVYDTIEPLELTLGQRAHPVGLEQILLMMAPGQEALAIVPPHLGYGLEGLDETIPPNATLIYRISWLRYPKQW